MKYLVWAKVFAIMVAVDWAWAMYVKAVAERMPLESSVLAGLLFLSSGIVTRDYVENKWMLIPATLGAVVGTFWAMS